MKALFYKPLKVLMAGFTLLLLQSNTGCKSPASVPELEPVEIGHRLQVTTDSVTAMKPLQYGFNTANFFHYYQPKDQVLTAYLDALKPAVLRFPGGTVANFYHPEEKGYGFRDADIRKIAGSKMFQTMRKNLEKEQLYIRKGYIKKNFIHSFSQLAKKMKAKVVYVANLFTGTDEEIRLAIQTLLNNGVEVIGVELGNEYYLKAYASVYPDITPYLNRAQQTARLLRQHFPGIPLAVVASPCPAVKKMRPSKAAAADRWNHQLAQADFYDAYVTHLYALPKACVSENNTESLFKCALESTTQYCREGLSTAMHYYTSVFGTKRKTWVTEWNVQGVFQYFGNTFLQAAYYGEFATAMQQYPTIEMAVHHNLLSGGSGFNLIGKANKQQELKEGNKYVRRLTYHVARWLQPLYRDEVTVLKIKGVEQLTSHFYLAAFQDKTRNKAWLLMINRSGRPTELKALRLPQSWSHKAVHARSLSAVKPSAGIGTNPIYKTPDQAPKLIRKETTVDPEHLQLEGYSIQFLEFNLIN